jgi:hypothetical protein
MHESFVRRLAKRSIGRLVWRETYRCLRLPWRQALALSAEPDTTEVRLLERAELQRYTEQPEYGISARFLAGIADRGDLCFGAFVGRRLASYRFFSLRPTAIDSYLSFHFPPRWVYAYKAFTHPAWRGKRLHRQLFTRSMPVVRNWVQRMEEPLGFVTLVLSDNNSSANALTRLGFEPIESFSVLRIVSRPGLVLPSEDEATDFCIKPVAEDQHADAKPRKKRAGRP